MLLLVFSKDDGRSLPDSWTEKPAFGTALEEHLKRSNREIALPIEACVMMLLETGMKEEVWLHSQLFNRKNILKIAAS